MPTTSCFWIRQCVNNAGPGCASKPVLRRQLLHHLQAELRNQGLEVAKPVAIEDNVWIGANCTITDGVRIGRDAVVGAGSVVTHDVAPYDIVAGVPARVIGNRRLLARRMVRRRVRHKK